MLFYLLLFILFLSFLARIVTNILYAVWLWQIKEYRWDRLLVHLRETKEGRRFLVNPKTILFSLLLLAIPLTFLPVVKPWYLVFATGVFVWDVWGVWQQLRNHLLRRPAWTAKAILIASLALIIFGMIFFSLPLWPVVTFVLLDRLAFPIISMFVFLLAIPTMLVKVILMELAKRKIAKLRNLTVIGITGSYGKSSTKELIADFLSLKYNVLKTPGSVNTDLGIALFILRKLKQTHEVFVVEIGAYKRGEIASVCNMVKPTIGILTGINEQHLSLFGSLENTKKAKMELIEYIQKGSPFEAKRGPLKKEGLAFFNGDDLITREMSKWSKVKKTYVYSIEQLPIEIRRKSHPFLSNVAAAYLLAQKLGVTSKALNAKVEEAVESLRIKTRKMGDVVFLDDTFNTNPNGFAVALDILATYKGKKVLVTPGIIELGSESDRIHRVLGEKSGRICDYIILTNDNFAEPIREGLTKTRFGMNNLLIPKREELTTIIRSQLDGKVVVLLEGRVPKE